MRKSQGVMSFRQSVAMTEATARAAVDLSSAVNSNSDDNSTSVEALVAGSFGMSQGLNGTSLQWCDHHELTNNTVAAVLPPGLVIVYLAAGSIEFTLDAVRFNLSASHGKAKGLVFNLLRPTAFTRTLIQGQHVQKWVISIAPPTLEKISGGGDYAVLASTAQHLFTREWTACKRQLAMARNIISKATDTGNRSALTIEADVLMLVHLSLRSLTRRSCPSAPDPSESSGEPSNILQHIDALLAKGSNTTRYDLSKIAAALNMSTSKLQRTFKQHVGATVMEYIRAYRLNEARDALQHKGISIGEAAYLAGYKHSSNFYLAFKKTFGYNPGDVTR